MTETNERTEVQVSRKGDGAYIRFSFTDMLQKAPERMPVVAKIDYSDGYAILGMPEMCTMRILATEFIALTPSWRILPVPCTKRDCQRWVVHGTLSSWTANHDFTDNYPILILPVRIQERAARGSSKFGLFGTGETDGASWNFSSRWSTENRILASEIELN
jgi:hypothetical protein